MYKSLRETGGFLLFERLLKMFVNFNRMGNEFLLIASIDEKVPLG